MADARLGIVLSAKDQASAVVRGLRGQMTTFKKDAMTGFGLGAGISVYGLAARGLGEVVKGLESLGSLMKGMGRLWQEEAADIARFNQILDRNAEGWRDNSAALDDYILSGIKLAFADDEMRDSIGDLVLRTHDLAEAQRLNALAMDLARAKNISLKDATSAVGKAFSGQGRALKQAGFVIDSTLPKVEGLEKALQGVDGAAETFAATSRGKLRAEALLLGEDMEAMGKKVVSASNAMNAATIEAIRFSLGISNRVIEWAEFLGLVKNTEDDVSDVAQDIADWLSKDLPAAADASVTALDAIPAGMKESMRESLRAIKKGTDDAAIGMAEYAWAIKHPMAEDKLREALVDKLDEMLRKRNRAMKARNANGVAIMDEHIAKMRARIAELDALDASIDIRVTWLQRPARPSARWSWSSEHERQRLP